MPFVVLENKFMVDTELRFWTVMVMAVMPLLQHNCADRYELVSFMHSIKITITAANVLENNSIRISICSAQQTRFLYAELGMTTGE